MKRHRQPRLLQTVLGVVVLLGLFVTGAPAENWPRFRGENGNGLSGEKGFPKSWSPDDYAWNVELPGEGHSSPVIWGDRLFLTSAMNEGTVRQLICLNARTGQQLWVQPSEFQKSAKHLKNSWASATPTTDGERVYVTFADDEHYVVTAYDFAGNVVWRRDLGEFKSQHGHGASPILVDEMLIVPYDQDGPSSLVALNRSTGDVVWTTPRSGSSVSYATPLLVHRPESPPQLICSSGSMGIASHDPATGRLNWNTGSMPGRTVGSPLFDGKLVVQPCGARGNGLLLLAVDPFQLNEKKSPQVVFERNKNLPFVPTPVVYNDHLYLWNDNGVVNCLDAANGNNVWTKRIGGNFSGSPICVDGSLYTISEDGKVVVLSASPTFEKFGEMPLGDLSHSTPACAHGRLYFRTLHRLACLAARPAT